MLALWLKVSLILIELPAMIKNQRSGRGFLSGVGVCVAVIAFSFIECSDSTDDGPGFSSPIYEKIKS